VGSRSQGMSKDCQDLCVQRSAKGHTWGMTQTTTYSTLHGTYSTNPSRVTNKMVVESVVALLVSKGFHSASIDDIGSTYFLMKVAAGCNPHNRGSSYLPPKRMDAIWNAIEAKMKEEN